jgi:hypothetical protein
VVHTPAHASWANLIESIFGILTCQILQHAWFTDLDACDDDVQSRVRDRNQAQRPVTFTWQPPARPRTSRSDH